MTLYFLGSGNAFCPERKNTSAFFFSGDHVVLLDCGETVFGELYNKKLLNLPIDIVLTHMHSDHVGSLGSLLSYCALVSHVSVNVYYPNDRIIQYLRLLGIDDTFYKFKQLKQKDFIRECTILTYPVVHSADMPCYGYQISDKTSSFYYSGDAADIPEAVLNALLHHELDAMYQDTCEKANDSHCSIQKLCMRIPEEYRRNVWCMHLSSTDDSYCTSCGFHTVDEMKT